MSDLECPDDNDTSSTILFQIISITNNLVTIGRFKNALEVSKNMLKFKIIMKGPDDLIMTVHFSVFIVHFKKPNDNPKSWL